MHEDKFAVTTLLVCTMHSACLVKCDLQFKITQPRACRSYNARCTVQNQATSNLHIARCKVLNHATLRLHNVKCRVQNHPSSSLNNAWFKLRSFELERCRIQNNATFVQFISTTMQDWCSMKETWSCTSTETMKVCQGRGSWGVGNFISNTHSLH